MGSPTARSRYPSALSASLVALALGFFGARAEALSLGDARVTSGLNAPLVAEIEVLEATPAELRVLRAEIPGRDVFTRYGLDWPGFLVNASVTLRTAGDGTPVLVLRTQQAVSEPFLTVLIAANWGRGRVLREYNLIVDRPNQTAEGLPPVEVQGPVVDAGREGAIERETAPDPVGPQPIASQPIGEAPVSPERMTIGRAAPSRSAISPDRIEVRRGDTLGRLADGVARRLGVTRSQALVGLYRANPEAFGASMNDLRSGAVLRIPDAAELAALPPTLVAGEVDRAVADSRRRSGVPIRVDDPGGRLRLVAPSEVSVGTGGDAAVKSQGSADGSDGQAGKASTSSSGRPDETIEQRLTRIERELIDRQRLLEVTQSQLAELQARASATSQVTDAGLLAPLRTLLGKAWWLWFLALAAVGVLVSLAMAARRRAASAESELETYLHARTTSGVAMGAGRSTAEPVSLSVVPSVADQASAGATASTRTLPLEPFDDLEGDPQMSDEAGSKLDLARAFIEMGDPAAARTELEQVLASGDEAQREDARRLLDTLG
jgi:pilus assembly protein FimV